MACRVHPPKQKRNAPRIIYEREQECWPSGALSLYPEGPRVLFRISSSGPCEPAIVPQKAPILELLRSVGSVKPSPSGNSSWGGSVCIRFPPIERANRPKRMAAPTDGMAKPSDLSASAQIKKAPARRQRLPKNSSPYVDCPFLGATSPFAGAWVTKAILISLFFPYHLPCSRDQKFLPQDRPNHFARSSSDQSLPGLGKRSTSPSNQIVNSRSSTAWCACSSPVKT